MTKQVLVVPSGTIPATTSVMTGDAMNAASKKSKRQRKNQSKKKKKGSKTVPFLKDVTDTASGLFGDSGKLTWIAIAVAVVVSHNNGIENGFLGDYFSGSDNQISKWVVDNSRKTLGFVCMAPVIMTLKDELRFRALVACVAGVLTAPALSLAMYGVIAGAVYVALNVKSKTNRMYILILCMLLAYKKIDVLNLFNNNDVSSSPRSSPAVKASSPLVRS